MIVESCEEHLRLLLFHYFRRKVMEEADAAGFIFQICGCSFMTALFYFGFLLLPLCLACVWALVLLLAAVLSGGQGVGVKITGWRRSFVGGFTSLIASIDRNKADFNLSASDRAALLS